MGGWRWAEVRRTGYWAFFQGGQVGSDTFIKDPSQVVEHRSPSGWQRAEEEEATAGMFPGRELVAQNGVHAGQKRLDFLGQLLGTV